MYAPNHFILGHKMNNKSDLEFFDQGRTGLNITVFRHMNFSPTKTGFLTLENIKVNILYVF